MLRSITRDAQQDIGIVRVNDKAFFVHGLGFVVQVAASNSELDCYWTFRPPRELRLSADLQQIIIDEEAVGCCVLTSRFEHETELKRTMSEFMGVISMVVRTDQCCLIIVSSAAKLAGFDVQKVPWVLSYQQIAGSPSSSASKWSKGSRYSSEPASELRRRLKRERFKSNEDKIEALLIRDELTDRFSKSDSKGLCVSMCSERESLTRTPVKPYEQSKMVKAYQRAAADQLVSSINDLRPPEILWETVKYLMALLIQDPGSSSLMAFISDRLHAIRKDIIQQVAFDSQFSKKCLEAAVRFYVYASISIEESMEDLGSDNFLLNDCQLRSTLSSLLQASTCDDVLISVYLLIGVSAYNPYASDDWAESTVCNLRPDNRYLKAAWQIRKHVLNLNCPSFWLEFERTLALPDREQKLIAMMMLRIADGLCAGSLQTILSRQESQSTTSKQSSAGFTDPDYIMTMLNCDDEQSLMAALARFKLSYNQQTCVLELNEPLDESGYLKAAGGGRHPLLGRMFDSAEELVQFLLNVDESETLNELPSEKSSFDEYGKYIGHIPEGDDPVTKTEEISEPKQIDFSSAAFSKKIATAQLLQPPQPKFEFKTPAKPLISTKTDLASAFQHRQQTPEIPNRKRPTPTQIPTLPIKRPQIQPAPQQTHRLDYLKQSLSLALLPEITEPTIKEDVVNVIRSFVQKDKLTKIFSHSFLNQVCGLLVKSICAEVEIEQKIKKGRLNVKVDEFKSKVRKPFLLQKAFDHWRALSKDMKNVPLKPGVFDGPTSEYCMDLRRITELLNSFDHMLPTECSCKIVIRLSWFPFSVANRFSVTLNSGKRVHVLIISGFDPIFMRKNPQHELDTSACIVDPPKFKLAVKTSLIQLDSLGSPSKLTDAICASVLKRNRRLTFAPVEVSVWSCLSFVRSLRCRNPMRLLARVLCKRVLDPVQNIPPIPSSPEVCIYQNTGIFRQNLVSVIQGFQAGIEGYEEKICGGIALKRLRLWGCTDEASVWKILEKEAEPMLVELVYPPNIRNLFENS